jgi:predicted aldo/keto reductase-like oxidoreductase
MLQYRDVVILCSNRNKPMRESQKMKSKSNYSRREFLSRSSVGLASAGLMGLSKRGEASSAGADGKVIYRTLGRTGIRVPIVSMGVMNASNPALIPQSYEIGIRLFDTAHGYQEGNNERMIGEAIEKMGVRKDVVIVTKVHAPGFRRGSDGESDPSWSKERVRDEFLKETYGCLERLRTDYADIMMLQNIASAAAVRNPGVKEALTQIKKEGKARYLGISTHKNQHIVIDELVKMDFYDVALTSINFTMADNTALLQSIENAAKNGIGIMAMKTQGGGRSRDNLGPINETAVLKWVLRNENIATAIPGYTNFEHMKEDFSVASNLELTPEEESFLADKNIKVAMGFCQQCDGCLETCPCGVEIPTLMRTHMYAAQYANFHQARATLDGIHSRFGLRACEDCVECTARCVNSVNVSRSINELKAMYV